MQPEPADLAGRLGLPCAEGTDASIDFSLESQSVILNGIGQMFCSDVFTLWSEKSMQKIWWYK